MPRKGCYLLDLRALPAKRLIYGTWKKKDEILIKDKGQLKYHVHMNSHGRRAGEN